MRNQRDYWNAVAGDKEFTIPLDLDLLRGRVPKDVAVLDYGCGYGRTLGELAAAGYRNLKGVDFSPAMIERGRRFYPNLKLEVVDGPGGLGEGEYGLIVLFAVLTCIESDEGQKDLVSRIEDSLAPGGYIYAMDFLLNDDPRNLERYRKHETDFERYGTFELGNGGVVRHHDAAWIESLFSGFETQEFRETSFTTMNGNASKGFSFFGRKTGS